MKALSFFLLTLAAGIGFSHVGPNQQALFFSDVLSNSARLSGSAHARADKPDSAPSLIVLYAGIFAPKDLEAVPERLPDSRKEYRPGDFVGLVYQAKEGISGLYIEYDYEGEQSSSEEEFALGPGDIGLAAYSPKWENLPGKLAITIYAGETVLVHWTFEIK